MSVAVLLVTHGRLADPLLGTIEEMLGQLTLPTEVLEVNSSLDPDPAVAAGRECIARLDQGDGVLLLTDAFGSTPSNIATRIGEGGNCRLVAGVNLPMLIRIYNYPELALEALADAAVEGGRRGVLLHGERQ